MNQFKDFFAPPTFGILPQKPHITERLTIDIREEKQIRQRTQKIVKQKDKPKQKINKMCAKSANLEDTSPAQKQRPRIRAPSPEK